jgi:xylan 1,4-beta-xylosidase
MKRNLKPHRLGLLAAGVFAMLAGGAFAVDVPLPDGATELIEAEATPPKSTNTVINDDTASGGKAVESAKTWEPIFESDAFSGKDGKVTIWARYRGGPIQLKTEGGTKGELDWVWAKPGSFEWYKVGTYEAEVLGTKIRFIRGEADGLVAIDAIAYKLEAPAVGETPQDAGDVGITGEAAGGDRELPSAFPDPDAPAVDAELSIDWTATSHDVPQDLWGVSLFLIVKPDQSTDPAYVNWLTELRPSLVRVHSAEMTTQWWDAEKDEWNREAIRQCFEPHRDWLASGDVKLMMCAPYDWPASVLGQEQNSKYIPPDRYDAGMANFRELVTILTDELDLPITHWELTNEWDNTYEKLGKLDELWTVFNLLAQVAREASPDTQVGGPAFTWPKATWIDGLLDASGERLDFLSWHGYAAGQPTTPTPAVMARAARMGEHAAEVNEDLAERELEDVETYKTEFNVQWTWQPYERRHANSIGAAFLTSVIDELARHNVDGATVWHAMGNAYGLVDSEGNRRATGQLYLWGNRYGHGSASPFAFASDASTPTTQPATDVDNPGLAVLPLTHDDGTRTLVLANQTAGPIRLASAAKLLDTNATIRRLAVTADGGIVESDDDLDIELPGYSVTFLTTASGNEPVGKIDLPAQHRDFGF